MTYPTTPARLSRAYQAQDAEGGSKPQASGGAPNVRDSSGATTGGGGGGTGSPPPNAESTVRDRAATSAAPETPVPPANADLER